MCDPIGPPPVPGAVEGGDAAGKQAGTWGRVHLTTKVTPLDKVEVFPTNQKKVMQTPGTSLPPATNLVVKGKGDAAATAAPVPPWRANRRLLRGRARRLLFGRLRGRGWPGGSVSGRVWLGVGRDDD